MGMGLAFTGVADDPSAIFFNPAGLGWEKHFEIEIGSSFLTKTKGDFSGSNPYPGDGVEEKQHLTTYVLPTIYVVAPLTSQLDLGLGIFTPYGLGYRWNDPNGPNTFSGRFVSQNVYIQTADVNPVLSFQLTPQFALAVGADYRLSKVMLENNQSAINPFTNSAVDIAHVKLNSDLTDNHGWGWNAGILFKPIPQLSIGAAYRSKIKVDYSGTATFTQIPTGNAQFDGLVASQLPQGKQNVSTSIDFPESANFGAAIKFTPDFTVALEADWTKWSRFNELLIQFQDPSIPGLDRHTDWNNSWAYRVGLEKRFSKLAVRAGYYLDKTPQPVADAGPLLADNDRNGYTLGLGYDTQRWGVDISDLYLKVKDLNTTSASNDGFYGRYRETVNVAAFSLRFAF